MTLIEVLVALVILGLALGLALQFIGPWLARERDLERQARIWRDAASAQTTLSEITAGALDPVRTLSATDNEVALRTLVPRLAPTPIAMRLAIAPAASGDKLVAESAALPEGAAPLLDDGVPLRLSQSTTSDGRPSSIVVEAFVAQRWAPVVVAPLAVNAQETCVFDIISQACR